MTQPEQTDLHARLRCKHESRTGGNDYQQCNICGLEWDYRRESADDVIKRQAADALASQREEIERKDAELAKLMNLLGKSGDGGL